MISSEVQRTLVKSPPELWAEISDPESLARHLGEFGEIRITRVEPEQRVEWQSGDASGSVVIKPSGWGTKVMLTVTRELAEQPSDAAPPPADSPSQTEPQAEAAVAVAELEVDADGELEVDVDAELEVDAHAELEADADADAELEVEAELEAESPPERLEPERRRGFFARLFGRRRRTLASEQTALDVSPDAAIDTEGGEAGASATTARPYNALAVWASQIDSDANAVDEIDGEAHEYAAEAFTQPEPALAEASHDDDGDGSPVDAWNAAELDADADEPDDADAADDISAEIRAAEEVAAEQVTAVLTGVLDRLGAAHHRPFSRA
jgi:hypothetical protein